MKAVSKAKYRTNDEFIGFRLSTSQKKYIEDISIKEGISMGHWVRKNLFSKEI